MRWITLCLLLIISNTFADRGLTISYKLSESASAPIAGQMQLYSKSYALIIGIDEYQTWPRLSRAVSDAEMVADILNRKGFAVTLLKNLNSNALEKAFEDFFIDKGSDPEARLFIWYAGHGHTTKGEGYLIPADGVFESDRRNFLRRSISLRDFGKYSRLAESKHVYTIFDSCFAGTIFNVARSAPPPAITRVTSKPVRQFLTSGDAGQTVSDDGTFARLFVEALEGTRRADLNSDGYVTAEELGSFLTTSISNYTNNKQIPRHGKLRDPNYDQGDFVFLASLTDVSLINVTPSAFQQNAQQPNQSQPDRELLFWSSIKDSTDINDFQAYLAQYPTGFFSALATNRINAANKLTVIPKQESAVMRTPVTAISNENSLPNRLATRQDYHLLKDAKIWVNWNDAGAAKAQNIIARLTSFGMDVLEEYPANVEDWHRELSYDPGHEALAREIGSALDDLIEVKYDTNEGRSIPSIWITPQNEGRSIPSIRITQQNEVQPAPGHISNNYPLLNDAEIWVNWNDAGAAKAGEIITKLKSLGMEVMEEYPANVEDWHRDLSYDPGDEQLVRQIGAALDDLIEVKYDINEGRSIPSIWITP